MSTVLQKNLSALSTTGRVRGDPPTLPVAAAARRKKPSPASRRKLVAENKAFF